MRSAGRTEGAFPKEAHLFDAFQDASDGNLGRLLRHTHTISKIAFSSIFLGHQRLTASKRLQQVNTRRLLMIIQSIFANAIILNLRHSLRCRLLSEHKRHWEWTRLEDPSSNTFRHRFSTLTILQFGIASGSTAYGSSFCPVLYEVFFKSVEVVRLEKIKFTKISEFV